LDIRGFNGPVVEFPDTHLEQASFAFLSDHIYEKNQKIGSVYAGEGSN
jgi:hypothetical protein